MSGFTLGYLSRNLVIMRHRTEMYSMFAVLITLLVMSNLATSRGQSCPEEEAEVLPGGVCRSIIVQNNARSMQKKLENCTVIEGYLHISLIYNDELNNYSFPNLVEITDNLVLYRVHRLKSFRNLFPNLAVIRGRELFVNFALIVFEAVDMVELGLINLRAISRGGIRITENKKLCHVNTIDWSKLGVPPESTIIKSNREISQCANFCPHTCPVTTVKGVRANRCWNSNNCQKGLRCSSSCGKNQTCMEDGKCCDKHCLGGCSGPDVFQCFSCKNVVYEGRCQEKCPPGTFMFFNRRCLTDKECSAMKQPNDRPHDTPIETAVLFRRNKNEPGDCLFTCPNQHMVEIRQVGDYKVPECVKCPGLCPKICNGTSVTSIQDVQKFKDCSTIQGDLTIEIKTGVNVAEELQKGLGQVTKITGKLHIDRTYPIINLFFLEKLQVIGTNSSNNPDKLSLVVSRNDNLQELFPEEQMKKMKLGVKAAFDNNHKLCPYKIIQFRDMLNVSSDMFHFSTETNGDRVPCTENELNLTIEMVSDSYAYLKWDKHKGDQRRVLSYMIHYRAIENETVAVNIYQGRDVCSEDVWVTTEREARTDEVSDSASGMISGLKPFTSYAVYVQAYTLSSASSTSMTQVKTFTTSPSTPSKPRDLEVTADSTSALRVTWKPPKNPNGIIFNYVITYKKEYLDSKEFDLRDYCKQPIVVTNEKESDKKAIEDRANMYNMSSNCCACPKDKAELEAEARKQEIDIFFEDYLLGSLYCKRYESLPFQLDKNIRNMDLNQLSQGLLNRTLIIGLNNSIDIPDYIVANNHKRKPIDVLIKGNITTLNYLPNENYTTEDGEIRRTVNKTEFNITGLEHFSEYSIQVEACLKEVDARGNQLCSPRAITHGRTKPLAKYDGIDISTIKVIHVTNTSSDVIIKWAMPKKPNGVTVKFALFYKKANQENLVAREECLSMQKYYKYMGHLISGLEYGNWTFQIKSVSLGGEGMLSRPHFFYIRPPPGTDQLSTGEITIIVVVVLLVIIIMIVGFAFVKNKFQKEDMTVISQNQNYISSEPVYTLDGWEVDRKKIRTICEIGQGSFGMVYEGIAKGLGDDPNEEIRVAVKTVNDRGGFNDKREFLKEATTMKAFDTFHVVKLIGVVSTGQPALVIMELMPLGDLKNYLRNHRRDEDHPDVKPPPLKDILQMAGEVADGMAYLADKKFVHRDLAARNCMVAEDKTVKIGDFGMTRDIYETEYYRKGGKGWLPVRWMAPESLIDGVFSSMSDVWSYGIVLWEMVTLAEQPYQGLSNEQTVKFIGSGRHMDMPQRCPGEMALLMKHCWATRTKNRPTFKQIVAYLLPHMNSRFEKVSYFLNDGNGHTGDLGRLCGEPEVEEHLEGNMDNNADDVRDDASVNSLSCEGAAAPRIHPRRASGFLYGSQVGSDGSAASVYDDGMDSATFLQVDCEAGMGADFYPEHNPVQEGHDDLDCPLIQEVPLVAARQPARNSSGLIELQPLLSTSSGRRGYPTSVRADGSPLVNPPAFPAEVVTMPPACTPSGDLPGSHKSRQLFSPAQQEAAVLYHQQQQSPTDLVGPSGDSHLPSDSRFAASAKSSPVSHDSPKPILRLPALNQPPGGSWERPPMFHSNSSGGMGPLIRHDESKDKDRRNNNASRDAAMTGLITPHNGDSTDLYSLSQSLSLPPPPPSNNKSSRSWSNDHATPTPPHFPGAIAEASSSAQSFNNKDLQDSHSSPRVNGLSNGHIPLSGANNGSNSNKTTSC